MKKMKQVKPNDSISNFEWARERALREKKEPNIYTQNRLNYLLKETRHHHGEKAVKELIKEYNSR